MDEDVAQSVVKLDRKVSSQQRVEVERERTKVEIPGVSIQISSVVPVDVDWNEFVKCSDRFQLEKNLSRFEDGRHVEAHATDHAVT